MTMPEPGGHAATTSKDAEHAGRLGAAIAERARRRGLSIDVERLGYYVRGLYGWVPRENRRRVLVVGIGHGHDSLLALSDGLVDRIVGADPYVAADGNSEDDRSALETLAEDLGLAGRLSVHAATVQDYLASLDEKAEPFGCIVMTDVLHHIFVTRQPLPMASEFDAASELFRQLAARVVPGGSLVIAETDRAGLRPTLGRLKGPDAPIDYFTKQTPAAWRAAAESGGWRLDAQRQYIPWRLRALRPAFDNRALGLLVCDRYLQHFRRADRFGPHAS